GQFDIIHNHFDFLPLTYSSMTRTPVVMTIHGFSSPGILPVFRKYNNKVHYVSISDAHRADDLSYAATIYHGLNMNEFQYQSHAGDYLLFFGRIHSDKGAREAIQIALGCNKRLVMAGIIQDQAYFDKHVKPHLTAGRIEYIGCVGPDERICLLGNAAALLHPIHFEEPFGLSVIESMACGTPVIAFNKGSMPELIRPGYNGYLVENVSEAVEAVENISGIRRANCREHIERYFTVEHMVANYIDTYERILATTENER